MGVNVDAQDIAREREIVEMALVGAGLTDREQRGRVVAEARARRGWGPRWFESLLARNALARKITAGEVGEPSEPEIARAYEAIHGPRRRVRVIVMASERDLARHAADVTEAFAVAEELGRARFMLLAAEHSSDVSSSRGGLLDPITHVDATYPDAFREAVFEAPVGTLTPVVALDEGFAVALVIGEDAGGSSSLEQVRGDLLDRLRLDAQQRAMAGLLDRLRARLRVEPLDDALEWSWNATGR